MASPGTFPKKKASQNVHKKGTQNKGRYFETTVKKFKKNHFRDRKKTKMDNKRFKKEEETEIIDVTPAFEPYESTSESDDIQEIPTINISKSPQKKSVSPVKQKRNNTVFEKTNDEAEGETKLTPTKRNNLSVQVEDEASDRPDEEAIGDTNADDEEVKAFKEKIDNLPLGKVRELQERLGMKLFQKLYSAAKGEKVEEPEPKKSKLSADGKAVKKEKKKQHQPRETSSKKPVSSFKNIFKNEKLTKKKWDPRFDERAGTLKEHCFETNYGFLDEVRSNEQEALRKLLAEANKYKDLEEAERIKSALRKMEDQERSRKEKLLKKDVMDEVRQENIDRMLSGQQPRYLPKGELRRKVAEKKFEQLKSENRLDGYLKRKAKKQAEKEKKKKFTAFNKSSFESQYGYH